MHVPNVDFMAKINNFDGSDEQLMLSPGGRKHRLNKDNNNNLRKRTTKRCAILPLRTSQSC